MSSERGDRRLMTMTMRNGWRFAAVHFPVRRVVVVLTVALALWLAALMLATTATLDNAAPLELLWTTIAFVGWLLSLIVLGGAAALLYYRYQERRNGAVRLLAWQFALVSTCVVLGLTAAMALGLVSLALPARTEDLDDWTEFRAAEILGWLAPFCLLTMVLCFLGITATKGVIGLLLRRYYTIEPGPYSPEHHPHRRRDDLRLVKRQDEE
jgi:hypothetical protein